MSLEIGDHVWYWYDANNDVEHTSQDLDIPRAQWFPDSNPGDPTDYRGHGKEIFNFVFYENTVFRGQPQMRRGPGAFAWLNRNPGNITDGGHGADFGQIAGKLNWHRFMIFSTREAGYDAIAQLLRTGSYIDRTIQGAFERYAPSSDGNNPTLYASKVAAALGVDRNSTTVREVDDSGQMAVMQDAIAEMEGEGNPGAVLDYDTSLPQAIQGLLA
jgi:hypothetical protein